MAKIAKVTGENGMNVYPGTIPQAVIDPFTKKTVRDELDDIQANALTIEEGDDEIPEVDSVAADTSTKALQDWDGNDIRTTYLKDAPKDGGHYARKDGKWDKIVIPNAITVDSAISSTSANPVQNKVVKTYVDNAVSGGVTEAKNYAKSYADGLIKVVTASQYSALGSVVNSDGVIYFITG